MDSSSEFGAVAYGLSGLVQGFAWYRYRRAEPEFPAFFAFLTFQLLGYAAHYLAFLHATPKFYADLYWYNRTVGTLFLVLVIAEITASRETRTKRRYWGAALGCLLGMVQGPHFKLWLDALITTVVAIPLLWLLWRDSEKSPKWWMAAGFAAWSASIMLFQYQYGHADGRWLGVYLYYLPLGLWIRGSFLTKSSLAR